MKKCIQKNLELMLSHKRGGMMWALDTLCCTWEGCHLDNADPRLTVVAPFLTKESDAPGLITQFYHSVPYGVGSDGLYGYRNQETNEHLLAGKFSIVRDYIVRVFVQYVSLGTLHRSPAWQKNQEYSLDILALSAQRYNQHVQEERAKHKPPVRRYHQITLANGVMTTWYALRHGVQSFVGGRGVER